LSRLLNRQLVVIVLLLTVSVPFASIDTASSQLDPYVFNYVRITSPTILSKGQCVRVSAYVGGGPPVSFLFGMWSYSFAFEIKLMRERKWWEWFTCPWCNMQIGGTTRYERSVSSQFPYNIWLYDVWRTEDNKVTVADKTQMEELVRHLDNVCVTTITESHKYYVQIRFTAISPITTDTGWVDSQPHVGIDVTSNPPRKVRVYAYAISDYYLQEPFVIEDVQKIAGAHIAVMTTVLTTVEDYPGPYVEVEENTDVVVRWEGDYNVGNCRFINQWDVYRVGTKSGDSFSINVGTSDAQLSAFLHCYILMSDQSGSSSTQANRALQGDTLEHLGQGRELLTLSPTVSLCCAMRLDHGLLVEVHAASCGTRDQHA